MNIHSPTCIVSLFPEAFGLRRLRTTCTWGSYSASFSALWIISMIIRLIGPCSNRRQPPLRRRQTLRLPVALSPALIHRPCPEVVKPWATVPTSQLLIRSRTDKKKNRYRYRKTSTDKQPSNPLTIGNQWGKLKEEDTRQIRTNAILMNVDKFLMENSQTKLQVQVT